LFGGKQPQVNYFELPNLGQPYPGSLNPTWGQGIQSSAPYQGNPSSQPKLAVYMSQNPSQSSLLGLSNYLQTSYGPTGIPT
jgi:hypothetical protein